MAASISTVIFTFGQRVNGLVPLRFQVNEHNHQVSIHKNVSNEIINFLKQWLHEIVTAAGRDQRITQQLCDVLQQAFSAISLANNNNGEFNENLAVMIIDGALHLGDNLETISREFDRCRITLAVIDVAIAPPIFEVWNYYRSLAEYTGGGYMSLANAGDILNNVILSAINGEDRLRQAFRHMNMRNAHAIGNNIIDMNEQNQITDGVGDLPFDHGLSE